MSNLIHTPETLREVESWAELPLTLAEIAKLMEIEEAALAIAMDQPDTPLGAALIRGRLRTKAELYKSILKHAKQGSTPAQAMALQLLATQGP
jgi:hypothetical protein